MHFPAPSDGAPAVEVDDLVVRYGDHVAVDDLSFRAEPRPDHRAAGPQRRRQDVDGGDPRGLPAPDRGRVRVLGLDPGADHAALVPHIGVMLQSGGVYTAIRPPEVLRLFASYYDDPADPDELLERVGLADRRRSTWRQLSGGEQQRLSLALALVGRPEVAFLDEPTAGIDPSGRQLIRQIVAELREEGVAVVLTTHDLDEAEQLADRVVIIDHGRLLADGTPTELMSAGQTDEVRFGAPSGLDVAALATWLDAPVTEESPGEYRVGAAPTPAAVARLTAWLAEHDLPLADLRAGRQTLEDVFLRLTQTAAEVASPDEAEAGSAPGPGSTPAVTPVKAFVGQTRAELALSLRQGEQLLVSIGIPLLLLVFFSLVDVLPLPDGVDDGVDFLAPGILALAVMSSAMVSLGIGTGFERQYGVLKRLGATPLGRTRWVAAKIAMVLVLEVVQVVVLVAAALLLGWSPGGQPALAPVAIVLGTAAFAGLGLLLAGTLRGTLNLAVTNGLYLVLLLLGGMIIPFADMPGAIAAIGKATPAGALSQVMQATLRDGAPAAGASWVVLAVWAVALPVAAIRFFRWE